VTKGGDGTKASPWRLATPSGGSGFAAYRDGTLCPAALVVVDGDTQVRYHLACIAELYQMLAAQGDWMALGEADEYEQAVAGSVEAWARSVDNPLGAWYGLTAGRRGFFGRYVPPVLEHMGLAEVEHNLSNNRMRAQLSPASL